MSDLNLTNIRHRKKQKYNVLREQMEFYFSDANLRRDRFMKDLYERFNGDVPLNEFLIFNCIKRMTTSIDDIIKAIEKSDELICDKYGKTVKRTNNVIQVKEDIDDYMIYVESIPSTVDIKWLQRTFVTFGKIDHISLPRFKKTNQIKEFAFIEFHNKISVGKAIKYFDSFDGLIDCDNENIQYLYSIKTYGDEEGHTLENLHANQEKIKKLKTFDSNSAKKIRLDNDVEDIKRLIDCKKYYNKNEDENNEEKVDMEKLPKVESGIIIKEEETKKEKKNSVENRKDDEQKYYCCEVKGCNHEDDDDDEEEEEEEGEEEGEEEDEVEEDDDEEEDDDCDEYEDMSDDEDVEIAEADEADVIGEANVAEDISNSCVNRYPDNENNAHNYNIAKYDNIKDVSNLFNSIKSKIFDSITNTDPLSNKMDEKKKYRRKRKLKKIKKPTDASIHDLKIMTKKEWKRLRNIYLNLQRDLKKNAIRKGSFNNSYGTQQNMPTNMMQTLSRFYKPHLPLLLPPPTILPQLPSSQPLSQTIVHKQKHFYKPLLLPPPPPFIPRTYSFNEKKINNDFIKPISPLVGYSSSAGYTGTSANTNDLIDVKFVPNVILYIQFAEPCTNVKEFKDMLREKNKETVKYIDVKEGDAYAHVRLVDSKYVCDVLQCLDLPCKLLSGNDELEYWMKINKDRKDKITKNIRVKKEKKPIVKGNKIKTNTIVTHTNNHNKQQQRGNRKNRRINKVQKNKHTYFND